jgi:hypothetical protein
MTNTNSAVIIGDSAPAPQILPLEVHNYFTTPLYAIQQDQFLEPVRQLVNRVMGPTDKKKLDPLHPLRQSPQLYKEGEIQAFIDYIGISSAQILSSQGVNMDLYSVEYHELWCQEHHRHSSMDQHAHSYGSQIVGFYFLDVPRDSAMLCFHDPRAGKQQTTLREVNPSIATISSNVINIEAREGLMVFTNSWLAHSFGRHGGSKPLRFIHFNLGVTDHRDYPQQQPVQGEATVV